MPLTEQEKVRVRDLLGFLNVANAQTFALGMPAGVETQFIIEKAMDYVPEHALFLVREHMATLQAIDGQSIEDMELMAVNGIGDITVNQEEQKQLDTRRRYWRGRLCNALGVYPNPFDQTNGTTGTVGNVRVR